MTHFLVMLLFAVFVSAIFSVVARDTPKERLFYGLKVFAEFVGIGIALAWILYFLPL
jgi:hypothetical protein